MSRFHRMATVIDCYSRHLVGFAIADHLRTSLIEQALHQAVTVRGSLDGAVFHSEHGCQYASNYFNRTCRRLGVKQSMGIVGISADNALAESFNATLKRELLAGRGNLPQKRLRLGQQVQRPPQALLLPEPQPRQL